MVDPPESDRLPQPKRLSRQPANRWHLIVDVSDQRFADEKIQTVNEKLIHQTAFDVGVAPGHERRLDPACRQGFQTEGNELVFDVAARQSSTFVDGVKLVLRADVDDKLAALLYDAAAEVLVLNTDQKKRRFVGDAQSAKGKLNIALAFVGGGNQIKSGRGGAVGLRQRNFLQHEISSQ